MYADDTCQLMQLCMGSTAATVQIKYPQFPLSEFLYTLLRDGVELRNRFSALEELPRHVEQYRAEHPGCLVTGEELLGEGWLVPFMDRWDFNVVPEEADLESDWLEPGMKERTAVLCWLLARRKGAEGVFVPRFGEMLVQFSQRFPEMPGEDWFVQRGLLKEHRQLYHGNYCGELAEALAFLWTRQTGQDPDQWLDLASALGMLRSALELLPLGQRDMFLERILIRLETGTYPDLQSENTRIALLLGWQQHRPAAFAGQTFFTGDLVTDFHIFDQSYWAWSNRLYCRYSILAGPVSVLCRYLGELESPLFTRAVKLLRRLAVIGCLSETYFPAEAILRLWESPEASLIACERMTVSSMQRAALPGDGFDTLLGKLAEQVLSRDQPEQCGEEYLSLLRYFAHQPPGGLRGERAAQALGQLLTPLRRGCHRLEPMLEPLAKRLEWYLERESEALDWARDFRLTCLLVQKVYYHGDVPVAERTSSFRTLRQTLRGQYMRLFRLDGGLGDTFPSLLDDTCFFQPLWYEVYRQEGRSQLEQCQFLQPGLLPPEGEEHGLTHYHRCVMHLTVLTVLMQNRQGDDPLLETAFVETLVLILCPANNLLNYDRIAMLGAQTVFEAAMAQVRSSETCFAPFMEALEHYGLPELVLICHGATDSALRERCSEIIEAREKETDALQVFSFERLVQIILDEEVESLYTLVEGMLEHRLDRWRGQESEYVRREREQVEVQLNRVWYQGQYYDRILKEGREFYRALVWMKSPEHRDLDRAERTWKQLLERKLYPGYAINLIFTYTLQYQAAQGTTVCGEIKEKAVLLRERVESEAYPDWQEEDQQAYVQALYTFYRATGTERERVIQTLSQELDIPLEQARKLEESEADGLAGEENDPVTIEPENPVCALRQYCTAPLMLKSEWFFQLKSCPCPENPQTALLLWCVMNTLDHMSAYGPQLLVGDKLGEDRCSQLIREFFNHGYPEMYGLTMNDQEKTGHTGHKNKNGTGGIGEVDLMIKHNGHRAGMVEALVLENMDRSDIHDHILQLQGYNIQYVPTFLIVYGNTTNPEKLWESYRDYIVNEFTPGFRSETWGTCEVQDFQQSPDYIPSLHSDFFFKRHMLRMVFTQNGRDFPPMYHVFLNLGSRELLSSASEAREKRKSK